MTFEESIKGFRNSLLNNKNRIRYQGEIWEQLEYGDRLMTGDMIYNINPYCKNVSFVDRVTSKYAVSNFTKYPVNYCEFYAPLRKRSERGYFYWTTNTYYWAFRKLK